VGRHDHGVPVPRGRRRAAGGGHITDRFGVKFTVAAIMFADILTFGATGFVTSTE
jgi:hypothetical protein